MHCYCWYTVADFVMTGTGFLYLLYFFWERFMIRRSNIQWRYIDIFLNFKQDSATTHAVRQSMDVLRRYPMACMVIWPCSVWLFSLETSKRWSIQAQTENNQWHESYGMTSNRWDTTGNYQTSYRKIQTMATNFYRSLKFAHEWYDFQNKIIINGKQIF